MLVIVGCGYTVLVLSASLLLHTLVTLLGTRTQLRLLLGLARLSSSSLLLGSSLGLGLAGAKDTGKEHAKKRLGYAIELEAPNSGNSEIQPPKPVAQESGAEGADPCHVDAEG